VPKLTATFETKDFEDDEDKSYEATKDNAMELCGTLAHAFNVQCNLLPFDPDDRVFMIELILLEGDERSASIPHLLEWISTANVIVEL
jgi:hypothetical protein